MKQNSEAFLKALEGMGGGNISVTCLCGRMHIAEKGWIYIEGEDEVDDDYQKAKRNPTKYVINTEDDSIGFYLFNGETYVHDCPCEALPRLEALFWNQRDFIVRFYQEKKAQLIREAESISY